MITGVEVLLGMVCVLVIAAVFAYWSSERDDW